MDSQDRKILNILQRDGRCPYAEIGGMVGLSTTAVKDRIDKLLANRVLQNYSVNVDHKSIGYGVIAFILIAIDKPEDCATFEKSIADVSKIQECHHVTGAFNYMLKVMVLDMADLENLLSAKIKIPGLVSRTETTIVFSSPKMTGFVECLDLDI